MPNDFPRRILLCATGLSPQIVTETLYALGVADTDTDNQSRWLPTEVHLITTASGAQIARDSLLHPDGGAFHSLLADYPGLGQPQFMQASIHVIAGADGNPLDDIRTPHENAAAANSITALMAELTRDDAAALHVSIAGGRKTMGFYLGYAFSLFARPQDQLSHVLVSSPFESHPEFFFPPKKPRRLATRDGSHIDTADARVTLAGIPVVRLRHGQPKKLLAGHASYGETVDAIQQSLAPPHLFIDLQQRRVECGGQPVRLPPSLLAWLAWWAEQALQGRGEQSWRSADASAYLRLYRRVIGVSVTLGSTERRLRDGMEKQLFQEYNAKLERKLREQLGLAAEPYLLATSGKRPETRRSLALAAGAITLRT